MKIIESNREKKSKNKIAKKDLEKNLRALLNEAVEKLDLVSRQEIDRQKTALQSANQRLAGLQKQVELLEETLKNKK